MQWPCFNPRPRAGGDGYLRQHLFAVNVSIHAPARGATEEQREMQEVR